MILNTQINKMQVLRGLFRIWSLRYQATAAAAGRLLALNCCLAFPVFGQRTAIEVPIGPSNVPHSRGAQESQQAGDEYQHSYVQMSRFRDFLAQVQLSGIDFLPLSRVPSSKHSDWIFGLSLKGVRRGSCAVFVEGAVLHRGDGYVAYDHGSLVEWYIDDESGLEHVFEIASPPLERSQGLRSDPLELQLELRGDLCLRIQADRRNATLVDSSGTAILSYSGLRAWDAEGRELDAYLHESDDQLFIAVDDAEAHYPIVIDPLIGCLRARLSPMETVAGAWFGYSVALDGDTLAITSRDVLSSNPRGAVYVYRRQGQKWVREAKLVSSSLQPDGFGADVAIHADTIAVGAVDATDFGLGSGAVFVFTRTGNQWNQQARILASDGASDDFFGHSLAVQSDRLVVGAWQDDDLGVDSGSVYVFERSGTAWSQVAKLHASNGAMWDQFGTSVDLDGSLIVMGAPFHGGGETHVYRYSSGLWTQEAILTSPGSIGVFGWSVATSYSRIIAGERGSPFSHGAAHVFKPVGNNWILEASLSPLDSASGNQFGSEVDVSNDRIVIGALGAPPLGAAYVFGNASGTWDQLAKLVPFTTSWMGAFGNAVALGGTAICVGDYVDSQVANGAGAAYIFDLVEAFTPYCTAKTNSLGCTPVIAAVGAASANASQGMVISCSQVRNNTPGLLMYSITGRNGVPFQGGTLCLKAPIKRTPVLASGGTPAPANDCSGLLSIDMNSFARGLLGGNPIPELDVIGTVVQCQWWGRDQGFPAPFNSMLSAALEYTIVQ